MADRAKGRIGARVALAGALLCAASGCAAPLYEPAAEDVPEPPRESRAAWIATVFNIDWPSQPGLPVKEQQRELLALLDRAAQLHLNTVVFQVRPACDAFYESSLEPWSRFLCGASDQRPEPFYDPLEFAVAEAHARGLELHAWFNPYRAIPSHEEPPLSPRHPAHPDGLLAHATHAYGELTLLDPGLPETRAHSTAVILDVVERYDVDAVHMDDYFYPYPQEDEDGETVPFPDDETFAAHGGGLSRSDWRRSNVDTFVRELALAVHGLEPWVRVGIAPFGIWRPHHPESVRGLDAYEALSADSRRWLSEGWVDYLSPQLYWGIDFPEQPFADLLDWWEAQNTEGRHMWPGISSRWIESARDLERTALEILNQIALTRAALDESRPGHCHWNLSALVEDRGGIAGALLGGPYLERALVPPSPWLGSTPPAPLDDVAADADEGQRGVTVSWEPPLSETRWVALQVRAGPGDPWQLEGVRPGAAGEWRLDWRPAGLALRPVSATGILGPVEVLHLREEIPE
jgi:uncharacterized lipoprotein YddW (UPF0748 family)